MQLSPQEGAHNTYGEDAVNILFLSAVKRGLHCTNGVFFAAQMPALAQGRAKRAAESGLFFICPRTKIARNWR
jgi:hypothetical protein